MLTCTKPVCELTLPPPLELTIDVTVAVPSASVVAVNVVVLPTVMVTGTCTPLAS